jgi:tetratricopeptide (TPR) repeat protein
MQLPHYKNFGFWMLLFLSFCPDAGGTPFVPQEDAQVLERLPYRPSDPETRALGQMRTDLARNPYNVQLAAQLARHAIEKGRADGDPRYFGYAQAALSPWWSLPTPPAEIALLRATIRQSSHDFDNALRDLEQVLKHDPQHAQGWLTRAVILQVRGEYKKAAASCLTLSRLSSELIAITCASSVASLTGQAAKSDALLTETLARATSASPTERLWSLTVMAEIAGRLGHVKEAETHFQEALHLGIRDGYLTSAYADFLLDQGRYDAVIALLSEETRIDGLLLRLGLARKALHDPDAAANVDSLRARFAAARLREDTRHQREEARFALWLLHEPHEAVLLAQANWAVQKEPADARILLEAALADRNVAAAEPVLKWLTETHLEDVHLAKLARGFKEMRP